ncbi:hypothetical protein K2173_016748 [Erythroxylum novogranatense]|uniref:Bromo domain-containing protein n=1 Tax=Erythroxylum novogranatense TaxID=1862640 RepID=A0AAV8SHQ0_9ROSI|nr:hypothetical protein K2173_016748 [Erythroxylum novogranatense]
MAEGGRPRATIASTRLDQPTPSSSSQKWNQTLELILDILQRRDTRELFARPVTDDDVSGYYDVVKEPMDFGTMRAKLWEGRYRSLELFERDVFLLCSNALTFNPPATVFHTEARGIGALAKQLFRSLRTEPEKFEWEYVGTSRPSDKRPRHESGGGHTSSKHRKQLDVSSPSFSRNLPSSGPNYGIERRGTYRPQSSYVDEDGLSFASAVNAPKKQLRLNPDAGIGYQESLKRFAKDLGPTAQMVANRKLAQLPNQPYSFGFNQPSSTLQLGGVHYQQLGAHQMPSSFFSPGLTSAGVTTFRGKMAEDQSRWAPTTNLSAAERSTSTTSDYMDVTCASSQNVGGSRDSTDDLISTIMQLGDIQNMCAQVPSGSYYPLTGTDDVHTDQPQPSHHHHQFSSAVEVHSPWSAMKVSLDEARWLPPQTRVEEVSYFTPMMQGTLSSFAFDSQGRSRSAINYGRWSQQQAPWSPETICSSPLPPVLQTHEQIVTTPWNLQEHNITSVGHEQQQWQERSLFDQSTGMSFSSQQGAAEMTSTSRPPQPSPSSGRGNQKQPNLNLLL